MPDWCENRLVVKGDPEILRRFQKAAVGVSPWDQKDKPQPLCFNQFVPAKQKIVEADYTTIGFDWQLKSWGCKWGADNTEVSGAPEEGSICYDFYTPNEFPLPAIHAMSKQYPQLTFEFSGVDESTSFGLDGVVQDGRGRFKHHEGENFDRWLARRRSPPSHEDGRGRKVTAADRRRRSGLGL